MTESADNSAVRPLKILLGGSPCTFWSIAKSNSREVKAEGLGWELFKNYLIAKEKFQPDYFLYENNKSASEEIKCQISDELGVDLQYINSSLVSAQNRQRFYAHNIPGVKQPENKNSTLSDILEENVKNRLSDKELLYMLRETHDGRNHFDFRHHSSTTDEKSACLVSNFYKGVPYNVLCQKVENGEDPTSYDVRNLRIEMNGNNYHIPLPDGFYIFRKFTPVECERLQTLPDNYTEGVSNTQRYKMLGNGWTADVISHILSNIPNLTSRKIQVLSLYDGIGTGRYCLDQLGCKDIEYKAYEIDPYAIKIAKKNYPDIIECGDAFQVRDNNWSWNNI